MGAVHRAGLEEAAQRAAHRDQPLGLAPDGQQAPAIVARHAVALRAGHRRKLARQVLERATHRVGGEAGHGRDRDFALAVIVIFVAAGDRRERPRDPGVKVFHHRADQAPVLGRQPLAQGPGHAVERRQVVGDAVVVVGVGQRGDHRALEHPRRLRQ